MTRLGTLNGVRIGTYSMADVPELVPVHLEAFRGYANQRLGAEYAAAFLEYFCRRPSHAVALASWAGGIPVGYVCGLDPEAETEMNRALRRVGLRALARRPWLLLDPQILRKVAGRIGQAVRGSASFPTLPPACRPPVMGLISIGVAASARGKGVGVKLMEAFESECRKVGAATMLLSVYSENTSARRLYESQGWQQVNAVGSPGAAFYYAKPVVTP